MGTRRGARQLFRPKDHRKDSTTSLFIKRHKDPEQLLGQLESLYTQNQTAEVLRVIDCVIETNSELLGSARFFVLHAKSLLEFQGVSLEAESALHQALILEPNCEEAIKMKVLFELHSELRDGLYTSAEAKLRQLIDCEPENFMAQFILGGHLLWKTGATAHAVELLANVVGLRTSFLKAWIQLAMAYKKSQLYVLADQAFQECIALDPNPQQHSFYKTHLQAL